MKNIKWGYAIAVVLVLGLSGCYMDGQSAQETSYSTDNTMQNNKTASGEPQATQKSYASKEPTQKSTPGPKHTAAPQLPVIQ